MAIDSKAQLGTFGSARYPKLDAIKKNPITKSLTEKLVDDNLSQNRRNGREVLPNSNLLSSLSDNVTRNIDDATNIFQLLPDTELAMQVLISSILSPKDMVNVELSYKINNRELESELTGPMIEVIKEYFDSTYNIKALLPTILEECLFTKGSFPLLVLPESSIDDIINNDRVTTESIRPILGDDLSFRRSIGLLGGSRKINNWSLETFNTKPFTISNEDCVVKFKNDKLNNSLGKSIVVTDNLEVLKHPVLLTRLVREKVSNTLELRGFGVEAKKSKIKEEIPNQTVINTLYRRRNYSSKPYLKVKSQDMIGPDRPTEGHPLVLKLSPESIIPVHVPSDPSNHIGYFILLDQFGNPLKRTRESDYYRDLSTNLQSSNITSQLLEAGRRASTGYDGRNNSDAQHLEAVRIYSEIVEEDLLSRLKNGVYGDNVEISNQEDIYRIMLARALVKQSTQVLYVPAEMVTYFAFDYNQSGIGKSLLDNNKIIASIRAMLMFSSTMAAIKNSVGKTSVKIELDPADTDPSGTVEYLVHEYSKNRQAAYPLGASNPIDIIDFLQNAGIDVQVSGNAGYPETRMDVEDFSSNKTEGDSNLADDLKRKFFMGFGLSPETIDLSSQVEFATSIVSSNLLLAKRVIVYQDILSPLLKDFICKYTNSSSILMEELLEIISANKKNLSKETKKLSEEEILDIFFNSLILHLPRPDSAKLENQMTAFTAYTDALEKTIDAYLGEDSFMLKEFDDMEENIKTIRAAIISYFQREWLRNNNVLPELMDLTFIDNEGNPELNLLDIHGSHIELIGKSIVELLEKVKKDRKARDKIMSKYEDEDEDQDSGYSNSDDDADGEGEENDDFEGTSDGDDDDVSGGMDMGDDGVSEDGDDNEEHLEKADDAMKELMGGEGSDDSEESDTDTPDESDTQDEGEAKETDSDEESEVEAEPEPEKETSTKEEDPTPEKDDKDESDDEESESEEETESPEDDHEEHLEKADDAMKELTDNHKEKEESKEDDEEEEEESEDEIEKTEDDIEDEPDDHEEHLEKADDAMKELTDNHKEKEESEEDESESPEDDHEEHLEKADNAMKELTDNHKKDKDDKDESDDEESEDEEEEKDNSKDKSKDKKGPLDKLDY